MPPRPAKKQSRHVAKSDYAFKTVPRAHQLSAFNLARDVEAFALFMEQGTGKTKVDIDCSAWAYQQGLIDAWVIVAPAGVHLNWSRQELPKHLPAHVDARVVEWQSAKARSKGFQTALDEALAPGGFPILCLNVEAVLTEPGVDALRRWLMTRRCKGTIDESSIIKNPKAQRTKLLLKARKHLVQRRVLNGTPVTTGPLNLFSQCQFLDEAIFGYTSYYAFSHHYAEWTKKRNWAQGRDYEELICYRNLDELTARLRPYSFRVTKTECLDLPPKVYSPPRYFELSPEQKRLYESLRDDFVAELDSVRVTAPLAITRLLRLQQIACGYLPSGEDGLVQPIPGPNPRLAALLAKFEETEPRKAIVWGRFRQDILLVSAALREAYGDDAVVTYDGANPKTRTAGKEAFQDPNSLVRFFIGNPQAAGRGLDLYEAEMVEYYSNSFSLEQRLQSEDRAHRDGLKHTVVYGDYIALGTVDEHIVQALRDNQDVAETVVSQLQNWLRS